jgi:hypothetical protein
MAKAAALRTRGEDAGVSLARHTSPEIAVSLRVSRNGGWQRNLVAVIDDADPAWEIGLLITDGGADTVALIGDASMAAEHLDEIAIAMARVGIARLHRELALPQAAAGA